MQMVCFLANPLSHTSFPLSSLRRPDLCMQADLEARRFGMLHDLGMSLDRLAQVNPPIHGPTIIQVRWLPARVLCAPGCLC